MMTLLFIIAALWTIYWILRLLLDENNAGLGVSASPNTISCPKCGSTPGQARAALSGGASNANTRQQESLQKSATDATNDDNKGVAHLKPADNNNDAAANNAPLFTKPTEAPDDLKDIKGIGEVMEKTLNDLGITTFKQLAGFGQREIDMVNSRLTGFEGRIERDEWVEQAKQLAA